MEISDYDPGDYFDEMFESPGKIRPHYAAIAERLGDLTPEEFQAKQETADLSFLKQGVTFTVYGDEQGTERIFPSTSFLA
ncbi:MAG: hypothetical protein R3F11_15515 [Verrucomicrobiales bacterium]